VLDNDWIHFTETGNINYYIKHKENERKLKAENYADNNKGTCDKVTDYRGE